MDAWNVLHTNEQLKRTQLLSGCVRASFHTDTLPWPGIVPEIARKLIWVRGEFSVSDLEAIGSTMWRSQIGNFDSFPSDLAAEGWEARHVQLKRTSPDLAATNSASLDCQVASTPTSEVENTRTEKEEEVAQERALDISFFILLAHNRRILQECFCETTAIGHSCGHFWTDAQVEVAFLRTFFELSLLLSHPRARSTLESANCIGAWTKPIKMAMTWRTRARDRQIWIYCLLLILAISSCANGCYFPDYVQNSVNGSADVRDWRGKIKDQNKKSSLK